MTDELRRLIEQTVRTPRTSLLASKVTEGEEKAAKGAAAHLGLTLSSFVRVAIISLTKQAQEVS